MTKKKLSTMLFRIASAIEADFGVIVPPMAQPVNEIDFIRDQTGPHGQGMGPGKGQGCGCTQMEEAVEDVGTLRIREQVTNTLNKYGIDWSQDMVNELVNLMKQPEIEEPVIPANPLEL